MPWRQWDARCSWRLRCLIAMPARPKNCGAGGLPIRRLLHWQIWGLTMGKVSQTAKSARGNFCVKTLVRLASACEEDAKDPKIKAAIVALGLARFLDGLAGRFRGPTPTSVVDAVAARVEPLLKILERFGIQASDSF